MIAVAVVVIGVLLRFFSPPPIIHPKPLVYRRPPAQNTREGRDGRYWDGQGDDPNDPWKPENDDGSNDLEPEEPDLADDDGGTWRSTQWSGH